MNKRKSLSNSNSKSNSKKRKSLFINTNDYRNKKPSVIISPTTDARNDDLPVDHGFTIPTESTPARIPPLEQAPTESTPSRISHLEQVSVPKLNIHRKRGRTKHLSFSDENEKPNENEKENSSSTLHRNVATNSTSATSDVKVNTKSFTRHSEAKNNDLDDDGISIDHQKISESDLLYSETILNCNISGIHHTGNSDGKLLEEESEKSLDSISSHQNRIKSSTCKKPQKIDNSISKRHPSNVTPVKSDSNMKEDSLLNLFDNLDSPSIIDVSSSKKKEARSQGMTSSFLGAIKDDSTFAKLDLTCMVEKEKLNGDRFKDTFYGLPMLAKEMFIKHRGISKVYDWQDECLRLNAIEQRQNLIYSLPTSGGKTLVAEILILRELLVNKKNSILVLPYVAIVQEKVRGLSPFAVDLGFHVEEYAGGKGSYPPKKRRAKKTIYIATIEKANAIVNSFIETERTEELGMIVVDELHMVGEGGGRGSLLEILLTKVMFKCLCTQIIGMSATLGNMDEIQKFLKAEVYTNNFRPVELTEYVKVDNCIYKIDPNAKSEEELFTFSRKVAHPQGLNSVLASRDPDHILSLVLDVIPQHSCLIFCATKKNCESAAVMLAKSLPKKLLETKKTEREILLKLIQRAIRGVCKVLTVTIPFGIAYHHSGLTSDERDLIEDAYSSGVITLLCCTSTLAAGVNLPAKRVILRSPYVGNKFLTRGRYKQMVGRAGRAGIDSTGESILVLQSKDRVKSRSILDGPIPNCRSSLFYEDGKGLRQLILSLLGLKICSSEAEIDNFFQLTLFHIQQSREDEGYQLNTCIKKEVDHLSKLGLVTNNLSKDGVIILRSTDLGTATLKGCVNIDLAPFVYGQLKKALHAVCLVNELHLLYLVTPLESIAVVRVDWMVYYKQVDRLNEVEVKACEFIGISPSVLCRKATGQRVAKGNFDEFVYKRFYLTLIIQEILKSPSLWDVADVFNETRGFLQNLFSSTMAFMSLMIHFTEELSELWTLKLLFQALSSRITNVKNAELVALMELPGVKQGRATQLFKAGYRTIQHLAYADPKTLVREIEHLPLRQASLIVCSAKMILHEKIESLREEADEIAAIPNPSTS